MRRIAVTFPGKTGDILWNMPTVRMISQQEGVPVDFYCMRHYENVLPLIRQQPYINRAAVIGSWEAAGSPHGDVPPQPPVMPNGYDRVEHLGWTRHPDRPLADFSAWLRFQCELPKPVVPFLYSSSDGDCVDVAYAFNPLYQPQKREFFWTFCSLLAEKTRRPIATFDVTELPFELAVGMIARAKLFVGCRSSNYVMAHGVGQKVLVYEPDPWRRAPIFGFPHGCEVMPEIGHMQAFLDTAQEWLLSAKVAVGA